MSAKWRPCGIPQRTPTHFRAKKPDFFPVFLATTPSAPLGAAEICVSPRRRRGGHSKIRVAIVKCTFSAVFEQLISKVRNLLFSKIFPFFPKKNENSKFRTLLVSCSVTAENVQITIATRILLCPQIFSQRAWGCARGQRAGGKKPEKIRRIKNF
jgi:hypothetical protein